MLSDREVEHLLGFIGYGDRDANLWYLGMEEGGGGEDNLRARLNFSTFEDNYVAHKKLGITKFHEGNRNIQRTWRGMCVLSLLLSGKDTDKDSIRAYQADVLGRSGSKTLLCELMPLPKPRIGSWGYESLLPQFDSREDYYTQIMPSRISLLQKLYRDTRPSLVVGYGKGYWSAYKQVFTDCKFVPFDNFEVATTRYGSVVLCDHFTARTMNHKLPSLAELIGKLTSGELE